MPRNCDSGYEIWNEVIVDHPILDVEAENALLARIAKIGSRFKAKREDAELALSTIPLHNLPSIISEVEALHPKPQDRHDLLMAGIEGFKKAAIKFRPVHREGHDKPTRLLNFAFLYVRDAVRSAARKMWHDHISFDAECSPDNDSKKADGYEVRRDAVEEPDDLVFDRKLLGQLGRSARLVVEHRLLSDELTDEQLAKKARIKPEGIALVMQRAVLELISLARKGASGGSTEAPSLLGSMSKLPV